MNEERGTIVLVLGIRPDVIRASIIIRELRKELRDKFKLIWSGQHYSDNLKDIFFQELDIAPPDVELNISGVTDADLVSDMISQLSKVLCEMKPVATIFLGDTNTVTGAIAAAQLNIPILHIEGCMRSYDWRMPEEKYRTIIDHLSDVIYAYLEEYKTQGIAEGIPSANIVVTGNPIVDVINEYFMSGKLRMDPLDFKRLCEEKYGIESGQEFGLLTCHRRENVEDHISLSNIFSLVADVPFKVVFPAGYRTQSELERQGIAIPTNVVLVDPIGYLELLELMSNARIVLTDSGTIIEEAAIIGTPSIQLRRSTERPQVYDFGASVQYNPVSGESPNQIITRALKIVPRNWQHSFGDGTSSYRIVEDVVRRWNSGEFAEHQPAKYEPFSSRSYGSNLSI